MFSTTSLSELPKYDQYAELIRQLDGLIGDERDSIANCANTSALIFNSLDHLNWAGFYFLRGDELVLGPFQGRPACIRIGMGKGVCGTAAQQRSTQIVADVHQFPGHIACDAESRSEIVVPILREGNLIGVLDLDSPKIARFDHIDQHGLEAVASLLALRSDFNLIPS